MQLIAHRGLSSLAPENTLASFRLALDRGAEAMELDVHQTSDGALVVLHDDTLRRVGGSPLRVRDAGLSELRRVDVGSWFDSRFADQRVPLLEEVFDLAAGRALIHLEIKRGSALYPGIEGRVVAAARRRGEGKVVVSSFDHAALREVRRLAPEIRIGYLKGLTPAVRAVRETRELGGESLHVSRRQAEEPLVRRAHEAGLSVLVYTVNSARELRELDRLGVDGVFSDDVTALGGVLEAP